MKILKIFFALFVLSIIMASCTAEALEDNQTTSADQVQATGAEDDYVSNGSKGSKGSNGKN
jgi:hypothetical protein